MIAQYELPNDCNRPAGDGLKPPRGNRLLLSRQEPRQHRVLDHVDRAGQPCQPCEHDLTARTLAAAERRRARWSAASASQSAQVIHAESHANPDHTSRNWLLSRDAILSGASRGGAACSTPSTDVALHDGDRHDSGYQDQQGGLPRRRNPACRIARRRQRIPPPLRRRRKASCCSTHSFKPSTTAIGVDVMKPMNQADRKGTLRVVMIACHHDAE